MHDNKVVIEREFQAPIDKVWKALTDPKEIRKWSFDVSGFKPEIGFEFTMDGGREGRVYHHHCRVSEVILQKKIAYSWRYEGYPGNSMVTIELFTSGDRTRIKLSHEGLDSFPSENADFDAENFRQGWTQIVGTSLKEFVENGTTHWV